MRHLIIILCAAILTLGACRHTRHEPESDENRAAKNATAAQALRVATLPRCDIVEFERGTRRVSDAEIIERVSRAVTRVEQALGPFRERFVVQLEPRIRIEPDIGPQGTCSWDGSPTLVRLATADLGRHWDEQRPQQSTVTHEIAHARVREINPAVLPMLNEGIAQYLASDDGISDADLAWIQGPEALLDDAIEYPETADPNAYLHASSARYAGGWARVYYLLRAQQMSLADVARLRVAPSLEDARVFILAERTRLK